MKKFLSELYPNDPLVVWFLTIVFSAFFCSAFCSAVLILCGVVVTRFMFAVTFIGFAGITVLCLGGV